MGATTLKVSFSPLISVSEVPSHIEYSSTDQECGWYTDQDYAKFRKDRKHSVIRCRHGLSESSKHTSVGLEFVKSAEHFEQRNIMRETVICGVLSEQDKLRLQEKEERYIRIAEVSEYLSTWSKLRALERAQDLLEDLKKPPITRRRSSVSFWTIQDQGRRLMREVGRRDSM